MVEPLDTVAAGVSGAMQSRLFRFMDSDGSLLALVGERTVSAARVVATQLQDGPFPLRLCYSGPVLRNTPLHGGRRRESMQAGCELIGHAGLAADAECIALAATALEQGGVHGVQIDVGHAHFIPALLESAGLDEDARAEVLAALARRDLVAVEVALERTDVAEAERRLLLAFPTLRGGREILDTAALGLRDERPRRALSELNELWALLDAHGVTDRVNLDLGAVSDWDYYTGPTFEVFSGDSGFSLGSGGRYDDLLARFGLPAPATGFVLHVDRCHDAITRRDGEATESERLRIAWSPEMHAGALDAATRLRTAGVRCAVDLNASDRLSTAATLYLGPENAHWDVNGERGEGSVAAAVDAAMVAAGTPAR
jgi:ATP phosphoribosyltransferase regulatory subunit